MEFTALTGKQIENVKLNGESLLFSFDAFEGVMANIEITGIIEITKNDEIVFDIYELERSKIEKVEIEVTDLEQDTFSLATINIEDGTIYTLVGTMKGIVLNMEELQEILSDNSCDDCSCADCDDCSCDDCSCDDCSCDDCSCHK